MSRLSVRQENARSVAAEIVRRVVYDDAFSQLAISHALDESALDRRDRGFATHLAYGTLTYLGGIDRILDDKLKKGVSSVEHACASQMRVATYERFFALDPPASAVIVNEAVDALPQGTPKKLRGLVNGVLRNLIRSYDDVVETIANHEWHGLQPWMLDSIVEQIGEERAREVMAQWNLPSKTWIRNQLEEGELERKFEMHEQPLNKHPVVPNAFSVTGSVRKLPGFEQDFVVQDPGAQLAGWLCSAEVRVKTVMDLCAGLGGKTQHLHDMFPSATIHAVDERDDKLNQMRSAERIVPHTATLGTNTTDNNEELQQLRGKADLVLLDAPCSALGTIGRHPEIRWKRSKKDVQNRTPLQKDILSDAANFVTPGGLILYAVCTWTQQETEDIIDDFLNNHPNFALEPFSVIPNVESEDGTLRTWPDQFPTDGFYYARLRHEG